MVKDYLNQINGRLTDDVNLFTGGLNTYSDKAFIQPYEMPYVMNLTSYKPPMMCTRESRKYLLKTDEADAVIVSIYAYDKNLIAYVTRNVITGAQKLWIRYKDYFGSGTWETVEKNEVSLPAHQDLYFCYCRTQVAEYLYLGNQTCKFKIDITNKFDVDSDTDTLFPTEEIEDDFYGIPCWHKGRLFLSKYDTVIFSALNDFDNFTQFPDMSVSSSISADIALVDGSSSTGLTATGAYNTGAYTITLNGNLYADNNKTFYYDAEAGEFTFEEGNMLVYRDAQWQIDLPDYSSYAGEFFVTTGRGNIVMIKSFDDKLVIFCEHSIHLLYGDTPLTTSSYQFQLVDLYKNLGCISPKSVAVASNRLLWLGDDREIYAYSGSYVDIISQPYEDKRTSGLDTTKIAEQTWAIATATSNKYYIQLQLKSLEYVLLVYDISKAVWWIEDTGDTGRFYSITNYSNDYNRIIFSDGNGCVMQTTKDYNGYDIAYSRENEDTYIKPIQYKFETRVYGADGVDSRKTITKVYLQASADATVYITDSWTSSDLWEGRPNKDSLKEVGKLTLKGLKPMSNEYLNTYDDYDYEQQLCVVPKMYGERLNTFQVVVEGSGPSKFYLMKREWSAR